MYVAIYHKLANLCVSCTTDPRLKTPPETLDQLGESLLLLDQLQGEMKATENEFEPLRYIRIQTVG